MDLLDLLDRPIAYHACLARAVGSVSAGVLLSQAIYWQRRCPEGRRGWWWKTREEWERETALGRHEQDTARRRLRALGVLEEERRGIPPRVWYRLSSVKLEKILRFPQFAGIRPIKKPESGKLIGRIPATRTAGIRPLPEITRDYTETTTGGGKSEYLSLGFLYGGQGGQPPRDPAAWVARVSARLAAQGGLSDLDREQLRRWLSRRHREQRARVEEDERAAELTRIAEEREDPATVAEARQRLLRQADGDYSTEE